jgi:hypothetical protein
MVTHRFAHELLRMQAGVDDAVILTKQFVTPVAGNLAELVVDVRDLARDIGRRDDSRVIERSFQIGELGCRLDVSHRYTWAWLLRAS